MTLLRIRELTACARHRRVLVHMEDVEASRHFSFSAEPEDARRLAREMARGPRACHPIFDFIQALLQSWRAAPVRVVLEDVNGEGIGAQVVVRHEDVESSISCYPPDALTIALRTVSRSTPHPECSRGRTIPPRSSTRTSGSRTCGRRTSSPEMSVVVSGPRRILALDEAARR